MFLAVGKGDIMAAKRKSPRGKASTKAKSRSGTPDEGTAVPIEANEDKTSERNADLAQLSNDKLAKMAAKNRPPQSWYDEDMERLY
jgi:hypothetical protein